MEARGTAWQTSRVGTYTKHTADWLDRRYSRVGADGVYQAHMPIYGLGHPASEAGHAVRYAISFRLLRALDELEFDSLLAVGGGEGFLPHLVREAFGAEVAVADLSIEAALRARDFFDLDGAAVDATRLPFADDSFDVVVCSEVIEHLEYPVEALLELQRVARRAVLMTTLEFETDPAVVARHRFQRCRFPHFEQNLYLPDDIARIMGRETALASQFPMDLPEDGVTREALSGWLVANTRLDRVVEGGAGVFAVRELVPSRCAPRLGTDRLLEVLFERGSVPAAPLERRVPAAPSERLLERAVCPLSREPLTLTGDALVSPSGARYALRDGAPILYDLDAIDPSPDDLATREAARSPEDLARLLELRADLVGDAREGVKLEWDLTVADDRRGWMLNPDLTEVEATGLGVIAADNDPWLVAPAIYLPAKRVAGVRLSMIVHAPDAPVAAGVGQLFWVLDDDDEFTEARAVSFEVANSPEVREYTIDLSEALEGVDDRTLLMLRLDPADGACGIDLRRFEVVTND